MMAPQAAPPASDRSILPPPDATPTPTTVHHVRFNAVVHTIDAGFFGMALGFGSFVTVLPLFLDTVSDSPLVLGTIALLHPFGWHLPQILTAERSTRLTRFMPSALALTLHERIPFLGLAVLAAVAPTLPPLAVILSAYGLVLWIGIGGGLTATYFQSLVGKIMPPQLRGAFYGAKTSAANLGLAAGALIAGRVLESSAGTEAAAGFARCFLLAALATGLSWAFLALTREESSPPRQPAAAGAFNRTLQAIVRHDGNFRWYVAARMMTQLAMMPVAFLTVYAVHRHAAGLPAVGVLTAAFALTQTVGNPILGALGDKVGHRTVMAAGMAAATGAAMVAIGAPSLGWYALAYVLAGLANVAAWTMPLAMILGFGGTETRPAYIGLGNTLVAPSILAAPLLGGWIATVWSYEATFAVAAIAGAAAALLLGFKLRDPGADAALIGAT
jgi:MFS family permease